MKRIVGIDVGGTFTDLVFLDEEHKEVHVAKVSSTPENQSIGLIKGLQKLGIPLSSIDLIVHGTTVATNATLERKGADCGLLTTKGFRDIIEVRRRDRPNLYGMIGHFEPVISRDKRIEIDERADHLGRIIKEVSEREVVEAAKKLLSLGVEVVVVSYLHCYANPENEQKTRKALESVWPNDYIVLSSEIIPEFREFERTSTAAVNGYIQPVISRYLESLKKRLAEVGYKKDLLLIQSNGGAMSVDVACKYPINTILSGPAAGVIAAKQIASECGFKNIISCDMGGTSLDVALTADGKTTISSDNELEYGVPVRASMIDISTIGAGGGSIARVDRAGILQVGPESAGADPGPVCYGKGGREPTVTDANLLLGRINPAYSIAKGEGIELDVGLAERYIAEKIAKPLGLSAHEAAWAIVEVANNKISGSIRKVSIERGHDPREYTLVMFGGAGPLHAASLLREMQLLKAIIPYYPGITSAMGCIMADVRHDFVQTVNQSLSQLDPQLVHDIFNTQEKKGYELLETEREFVDRGQSSFEADMAYVGQTHNIRVALPSSALSKRQIAEAFEAAYRKQYGRLLAGREIAITNLRTSVLGARPKVDLRSFVKEGGKTLLDAFKGRRKVYFDGSFIECDTYERELIPTGSTITGPAVVEQKDTTIVIEAKSRAVMDDYGNLILEVF